MYTVAIQTKNLLSQITKIIEKELNNYPNIIIFYAADTGSRAFGIPNYDSDFDIQFIFCQKDIFEYISTSYNIPIQQTLEIKTQVFDSNLNQWIEVNCIGWDIIHFLRFLEKNNSTVINCLTSPNDCYYHPVLGKEFRDDAVNCIPNTIYLLGYFQSSLAVVRNNVNRYFFSSKQNKQSSEIPVKIYLYIVQYILYSQEIFNIGNQSNQKNNNDIDYQISNNEINIKTESWRSTFKLPPLNLENLMLRQSIKIPPNIFKFILKLISMKKESKNEKLISRRLDFEIWILYNFRRLYSSRGKINNESCDITMIDSLLRATIKNIHNLK